MPLSSMLLYLLWLSVVAAAFWFALELVKSFRLYFLSSYLGFVVTLNICGLLNLLVSDISSEVLKNMSPQGLQTVYILFGLAAFPLLAIAFYFFLTFVMGLLDERMSSFFRTAYLVFWALLFAVFLTRIQLSLKGTNPAVSRTLNLVLSVMIFIFPIASLIYLMLRAARGSRDEVKKGLMTFAVMSMAGYGLFFTAFFFSEIGGPTFRWIAPWLVFLANLIPIQFLRMALSRSCRPRFPGALEGPRMPSFRERFQLSNREGEILNLLLTGKSNKDIERELFVSHHTVRNHVHNIYQKLGVGSRLQLMNFVRTWMESGKNK